MTYTLLIWEWVPEEHKLYLIPDEVADKYRKYLEEAHNKFINQHKTNYGMQVLCSAVSDPQTAAEKGFEEYLGCFSEYYVDNEYPIVCRTILSVYLSGFML